MNWIEAPSDFLNDVETIIFFIAFAKFFKLKVANWLECSYWKLLGFYVIATVLRAVYHVIAGIE